MTRPRPTTPAATMRVWSLLLLLLGSCAVTDSQSSCGHNQRVSNGACVNCHANSTRRAGDSIDNGNTQCVLRTSNPICPSLFGRKRETNDCTILESNVCENYYQSGHSSCKQFGVVGEEELYVQCQYCDDAGCCSSESSGGSCVQQNSEAIQCMSSSRPCGASAVHF